MESKKIKLLIIRKEVKLPGGRGFVAYKTRINKDGEAKWIDVKFEKTIVARAAEEIKSRGIVTASADDIQLPAAYEPRKVVDENGRETTKWPYVFIRGFDSWEPKAAPRKPATQDSFVLDDEEPEEEGKEF